MAIILDEENNVVTVENQPEAKRTLFKNISDGNGGAIDEILERLDHIYPGTNAGFISSTGAIQSATADAEVYTDEFPATPGNKVSVTLKYTQDRSMWLAYCLYGADHTFISRTMLVNSVTQKAASASFTVPEGAYYCRLTYRSFNDANLTVDTTGQRLNDVQVAGQSIVINGVAYMPFAGANVPGVITVRDGVDGVRLLFGHRLTITPTNTSQIKAGNDAYLPVTTIHQHESAFYGLAKAAGDTTQELSANEVGNYTADAKAAIRKMLGLVEAELITEYVTEEDLSELTISTDLYGQPFRLRKAHILVMYPPSTTGADSYIQVKCLDADSSAFYFFGSRSINGNGKCVVVYEYESFGAYFSISNYKASSIGSSATNTITVPYAVPSKAISALCIEQNNQNDTLVPTGTRVILYGVKE